MKAAEVAPQPYFATVSRALAALAKLGAPVAAADGQHLFELARSNDEAAVDAAEKILDRYTLARVQLEANGHSRSVAGGAPTILMEQGWRAFLVRLTNPHSLMDRLDVSTGQSAGITRQSTFASRTDNLDTELAAATITRNWLAHCLYDEAPLENRLSGFIVEYKVIQLFSRDRGKRSAEFRFATTNAPLNPPRRPDAIKLDFNCCPSREVTLQIRDVDRRGCVAALTIKDAHGHIYPLQAMRLAPDMKFQPYIYRGDGETVRLPDGKYIIESIRGPEYLRGTQQVQVGQDSDRIHIQLQRWVDPAQWGWYSGDTHIHAAGCAHYDRPTEGVSPETIIRHVRGEALSIGGVLSWAPSWYYQKQFFSGRAISPAATLEHPALQAPNNAMWQTRPTSKDAESWLRYDVEVSGFPSSHCGHLVLLRLKEQDFPGVREIQEWPSWNLPILRWAKAQGAVTGYTHCGHGMVVDTIELPNFEIPPMNGTGTQEGIVDVTHGGLDFLSGGNTQPAAELNAWYHMLNCGFRLVMVGETDYPCIVERPGTARSYVRLARRPMNEAGYDAWLDGLVSGRLYYGDGHSHFLEFKINSRHSGGEDITLDAPQTAEIEALVAAWLNPDMAAARVALKMDHAGMINPTVNGWHIERARIGSTRNVTAELVVNGVAVDQATLQADGMARPITFNVPIARSSWVALRILPSAHTYPIFIQVDKKPIRASKRSAQWCRMCVDKLWEVKSPFIRESERVAAAQAFDYARKTYEKIASECELD